MVRELSLLGFERLQVGHHALNRLVLHYADWLVQRPSTQESSASSSHLLEISNRFENWYQHLGEDGLYVCERFIELGTLYQQWLQQTDWQTNHRHAQAFFHELYQFHCRWAEILFRFDVVTTLPSRNLFYQIWQEEKVEGVMVMADLDHFKRINDAKGHQVGDMVLNKVGVFFRQYLSAVIPRAWIARYGGEAFIFYLPHTKLSDAIYQIDTMRDALLHVRCQDVGVSCSFGLSQALSTEDSFFKSLRYTDKALHLAKQNGRNQVVVWPPNEVTSLTQKTG